MPTHLSKTELATILSALDGQTRNPANRDKALAALERRAAALGLTTDEILDAAPGLLDGRLSPEDWLTEITDTGRAKVERVTAEVVTSVKADPAEPAATQEAGTSEPLVAEETAEATKPQPRDGTKQAVLIAMLRRPDGADLDEIAEATGWQKHTIRGAISGALKKKLGLEVTSTRDHQNRRVYHITGE
jgi:hypothetical protein